MHDFSALCVHLTSIDVRIQQEDSELNLLGSKLITYKKEKTGRVACSQPGVTRLLGRLLRVAVRGVCSFVFSDTGHYTKLDGINVDSRRATLGRS